jgi:hypothetical protein
MWIRYFLMYNWHHETKVRWARFKAFGFFRLTSVEEKNTVRPCRCGKKSKHIEIQVQAISVFKFLCEKNNNYW